MARETHSANFAIFFFFFAEYQMLYGVYLCIFILLILKVLWC